MSAHDESVRRLLGGGGEGGCGVSALNVQVGGSHYKGLAIQPAEFSEHNALSFLEGCVVKRVCRHSRGGKGREDIEKAIHELQLILALHYGGEAAHTDHQGGQDHGKR